jgi:hypothetical protein
MKTKKAARSYKLIKMVQECNEKGSTEISYETTQHPKTQMTV